MYKAALTLYITCFSLYVLFSRQPDYFDGEIHTATIHFQQDSITNTRQPFAIFQLGKKVYLVNAGYFFRNFAEGEKVNVIYENSQPEKGAIYSWWGYWFTWGEILFSILLIVLFYQIAVGITKNPSPQALKEQLEYVPRKKRKYED